MIKTKENCFCSDRLKDYTKDPIATILLFVVVPLLIITTLYGFCWLLGMVK